MLDRAREVIGDKKRTEEGRKMLPQLIGAADAALVNELLDANPGIDFSVH